MPGEVKTRRLLHYGKDVPTIINSVKQNPIESCYDKPIGFWVSVEGERDWSEWCTAEGWGLDRFAKSIEIILAKDNNVLWLSDSCDIYDFTKKFGYELYYGAGIDWDRVSKKCQGVIIAPYVYSCRLSTDTSWYYNWDCASGCIWDSEAIAKVIPL